MNKTMLRTIAIVSIVLFVLFSGCVGPEKPTVEPTPAVTETPAPVTETPAPVTETPAPVTETPAPAVKEPGELWTPKSSDVAPLTSSISGCEELDQHLLGMYDHNHNGLIDKKEMEYAGIDYEKNRMQQSDYGQIKYAYEHQCSIKAE